MSKKIISPIRFIILLGVISLFSDMTYEGARSIAGPYLAYLGANPILISAVCGVGEFLAYGLRVISGYIGDRTKKHHVLMAIGYIFNIISIPVIGFVNSWQSVASLLFLERTGKAIRTSSRDLVLSRASKSVGGGFTFGLHHALDQLGAITGPVMISIIFSLTQNYSPCFKILFFPAVIAVIIFFMVLSRYPELKVETEIIEIKSEKIKYALNKRFWIYISFVFFIAMGYLNFPLIAYHVKNKNLINEGFIPLYYALGMGAGALSGIFTGRLFDKIGIKILFYSISIPVFFSVFILCGTGYMFALGIILWGVGLGVQESIMKGVITDIVSASNRGIAFGIYNFTYGISLMLSGIIMGYLYFHFKFALVSFSMIVELIAILILVFYIKRYDLKKS